MAKIQSYDDVKNIWLMKSEPEVYGIDDLRRDKTTWWEGVRNYQARNFMTQEMKVGDLVLYYHSNAEPSGIAGLARVSAQSKPDPTAFDRKSDFFDAQSDPANPRWFCVQIEFVQKFDQLISLSQMRSLPSLAKMQVLRPGNRLSITRVTEQEWKGLKAKFLSGR